MATISTSGDWLIYPKPNPLARLRLFCFPYAGGSAAAYYKWPEGLSRKVEVCAVQLPGRGSRLNEKRFSRMQPLVETLAAAMWESLDQPFAFFGHSLGALVCFELAHYLRSTHGLVPAHLFVSGRSAPQVRCDEKYIHCLPDSEFIDELRRLNGTPREILDSSELMQLMIPTIRTDFEVCETYGYSPRDKLDCPISAFGGLNDPDVPRSSLKIWSEQTTGRFSIYMLNGDHFFLNTSRDLLVNIIDRQLAGTV